jgi:hypothetical protein
MVAPQSRSSMSMGKLPPAVLAAVCPLPQGAAGEVNEGLALRLHSAGTLK